MTNHTPAPWNANDVYGNIYHEDCLGSIPIVQGSGDGISVKAADLDLILAAPDMYEALVHAKALLEMKGYNGYASHPVHKLASDALKKARGEV